MLKLKETGSEAWLLVEGIMDVIQRVQSCSWGLEEGSGEPVVPQLKCPGVTGLQLKVGPWEIL